MQNLQYFIDYNSLPSNSSHNSSTNETIPEYRAYHDHQCAQPFAPFSLCQRNNYNEYPRKIQKICENPVYENREIFYQFLAKENSGTFPFAVFQNEINYALMEQENLFETVYRKNREIQGKIQEINGDLSELKRTVSSLKFREPNESNNILAQAENTENKESLILKSLRLSDCFKYELALYSDFPNVLIRDRLFSFKVVLRDKLTKSLIKNPKKISLNVDLFSVDDIPKKINENKSGKPIIQIEKENFLVNGESVVGRLKISEVSSHFTKGLFILCVHCSKKPNNNSKEIGKEEIDIEAEDIRPLVITNIKVKSKK